MKTKFQESNLIFEPENVFNQETGNQSAGNQFNYRQRRKWSVYEIDESNLSRKYIGSFLRN